MILGSTTIVSSSIEVASVEACPSVAEPASLCLDSDDPRGEVATLTLEKFEVSSSNLTTTLAFLALLVAEREGVPKSKWCPVDEVVSRLWELSGVGSCSVDLLDLLFADAGLHDPEVGSASRDSWPMG